LCKSKVFISGPGPILGLTTVLGRSRRVDATNGVENYQEPTTYQKYAIRKHLNFPARVFKFNV
jgi:hypothetical protein